MLNHQKFIIVRKRKLSVSERLKTPIVKKKKKIEVKKPVIQSERSLLLLTQTPLGTIRHKKLTDAGWKYRKGKGSIRASYKRGDDKLWVTENWKWYHKKKQIRELKWPTILKKYLS